MRPTSKKAHGLKHGYRSGLEETLANQLDEAGIPHVFEGVTLKYLQPAQERRYTPDFVEFPNSKIVIESKGRFLPADRKKMLLVKEQHPELEFRLVFSNANARIYKGSKTRHWNWAEKHGFKWAHRVIPDEWLEELRREV